MTRRWGWASGSLLISRTEFVYLLIFNDIQNCVGDSATDRISAESIEVAHSCGIKTASHFWGGHNCRYWVSIALKEQNNLLH